VTPNGSPSAGEIAAAGRLQNQNQRPFTFQSPQAEVRFNQATGRIQQLEQRLEVSNTDLLRRLGEVRQLTGERQTMALLDLMQRVLQDRVQLHQYLVQSRAIWSGDMGSNAVSADDQQQVDQNAPAGATDSNPPQANPQTFPPR
jgi:hypothetical protein